MIVWMLLPGVRSTGICSIALTHEQVSPPRHVLAERDEMHLVVAVDELPGGVEGEHARALRAVGVVHDRADRRRDARPFGSRPGPPPRSRDRRARAGSSAPSPHTARSGGGVWPRSVRNSSMFLRATVRSSSYRRGVGRHPDVDLHDGDRDGTAGRRGQGDQRPARGSPPRRRPRGRSAPLPSPAGSAQAASTAFTKHDHERDAPHSRSPTQVAGEPGRRPGRSRATPR